MYTLTFEKNITRSHNCSYSQLRIVLYSEDLHYHTNKKLFWGSTHIISFYLPPFFLMASSGNSKWNKYTCIYGGLCLSIAWYLCKQKRLNAELLKTKNFMGSYAYELYELTVWCNTKRIQSDFGWYFADIVVYPHWAYNELQNKMNEKASEIWT